MSVIFKLKRIVKIILTRMITLLKCKSWYIWIQTHIKIALRSLYLSAHDIFRRDILFQVSIILSRSLDYETSICNLIDIFLVRADFCACIRLGGNRRTLFEETHFANCLHWWPYDHFFHAGVMHRNTGVFSRITAAIDSYRRIHTCATLFQMNKYKNDYKWTHCFVHLCLSILMA